MARPNRHQPHHLPEFLDPPSDPDQLSDEEVAEELLEEEEEVVEEDEEGIVGKHFYQYYKLLDSAQILSSVF
jgi:hypothetical protein